MRGIDKLRRAFLRWDHLLVVLVLAVPFVLLMLMGLLWLLQHNATLWFLTISLVVSASVVVVRNMLRRRWRREAETGVTAAPSPVQPDPDWLPIEKAVFAQASQHIAALTSPAMPWEALPEQALEVVNKIATGLNEKNAGVLSFTLPEALLLLESTAARYREHLRSQLPFSDQVSLATLYWLWRQRNRVGLAWQLVQGSSRVARFALNPAAGVLREIEQLVTGDNSAYLADNMTGVMQAMLLEEIAYGAIELYSGRLRFSDHELMQIELATSKADRAHQALPDEPLRLLFVGQTSAGKSTLINALLAEECAETDAAATTSGLVVYQSTIAGAACNLLDSEGIDGSQRSVERMLKEMTQADMLIWVVRANRPARDLDVQLKQRLDSWFESRPRRRKPPVVVVATGMDQLNGGQQLSSEAAQLTITAARKAIAAALNVSMSEVVPFSGGATLWNRDAVVANLADLHGEAQRVQRNRRRVEGTSRDSGIGSQIRRGGRGVRSGFKMAVNRATRAIRGDGE